MQEKAVAWSLHRIVSEAHALAERAVDDGARRLANHSAALAVTISRAADAIHQLKNNPVPLSSAAEMDAAPPANDHETPALDHVESRLSRFPDNVGSNDIAIETATSNSIGTDDGLALGARPDEPATPTQRSTDDAASPAGDSVHVTASAKLVAEDSQPAVLAREVAADAIEQPIEARESIVDDADHAAEAQEQSENDAGMAECNPASSTAPVALFSPPARRTRSRRKADTAVELPPATKRSKPEARTKSKRKTTRRESDEVNSKPPEPTAMPALDDGSDDIIPVKRQRRPQIAQPTTPDALPEGASDEHATADETCGSATQEMQVLDDHPAEEAAVVQDQAPTRSRRRGRVNKKQQEIEAEPTSEVGQSSGIALDSIDDRVESTSESVPNVATRNAPVKRQTRRGGRRQRQIEDREECSQLPPESVATIEAQSLNAEPADNVDVAISHDKPSSDQGTSDMISGGNRRNLRSRRAKRNPDDQSTQKQTQRNRRYRNKADDDEGLDSVAEEIVARIGLTNGVAENQVNSAIEDAMSPGCAGASSIPSVPEAGVPEYPSSEPLCGAAVGTREPLMQLAPVADPLVAENSSLQQNADVVSGPAFTCSTSESVELVVALSQVNDEREDSTTPLSQAANSETDSPAPLLTSNGLASDSQDLLQPSSSNHRETAPVVRVREEAVQESLQQSIVSSSSAQVQPFRHRFVPPVEPSAEVTAVNDERREAPSTATPISPRTDAVPVSKKRVSTEERYTLDSGPSGAHSGRGGSEGTAVAAASKTSSAANVVSRHSFATPSHDSIDRPAPRATPAQFAKSSPPKSSVLQSLLRQARSGVKSTAKSTSRRAKIESYRSQLRTTQSSADESPKPSTDDLVHATTPQSSALESSIGTSLGSLVPVKPGPEARPHSSEPLNLSTTNSVNDAAPQSSNLITSVRTSREPTAHEESVHREAHSADQESSVSVGASAYEQRWACDAVKPVEDGTLSDPMNDVPKRAPSPGVISRDASPRSTHQGERSIDAGETTSGPDVVANNCEDSSTPGSPAVPAPASPPRTICLETLPMDVSEPSSLTQPTAEVTSKVSHEPEPPFETQLPTRDVVAPVADTTQSSIPDDERSCRAASCEADSVPVQAKSGLWESLYSNFTNISTAVSSFVKPKEPEKPTKRAVEVKALKSAALKKRKDEQREEELRERNRKYHEAGELRKRKAEQAKAIRENEVKKREALQQELPAVEPVRANAPEANQEVRLIELSTEERLKRAEERRQALIEEEKRKRAQEKEERQRQRELFQRRRDEELAKKQQTKKAASAAVSVPTSKDALKASSSSSSVATGASKQAAAPPRSAHKFAVPAVPPSPEPVVEIPINAPPSDSDEDDEDSDREQQKKRIPKWAQPAALLSSLAEQARIDPDTIFPPDSLKSCNLEEVFVDFSSKTRFTRRTSSGNWVRDRLGWKEELDYKRRNGYL